VPRAVQEEIVQINDRLIDTDVAVSYEGSEEAAAQGKEGVVVSCAYKCVAVSPSLNPNKLVSRIFSRVILKRTFFAFPGICRRGFLIAKTGMLKSSCALHGKMSMDAHLIIGSFGFRRHVCKFRIACRTGYCASVFVL
jgi:hypothetical protein